MSAGKQYQVLANGRPADNSSYSPVESSWNRSRFTTYAEALDYLSRWMGYPSVDYLDFFKIKLNEPIDTTGYGHTIEIREVEG